MICVRFGDKTWIFRKFLFRCMGWFSLKLWEVLLGRRGNIPLISRHWSIVWIPWPCNWLFFTPYSSGRIWDIFQLRPNWSIFFKVLTPYYLWPWISWWKCFFAKIARHVCLLARTFLCILEYEFSNNLGTNKMGKGSYIKGGYAHFNMHIFHF